MNDELYERLKNDINKALDELENSLERGEKLAIDKETFKAYMNYGCETITTYKEIAFNREDVKLFFSDEYGRFLRIVNKFLRYCFSKIRFEEVTYD